MNPWACPECKHWPHEPMCRWRGAGLVLCGPWVVCAECGAAVSRELGHRRSCSVSVLPAMSMPADAPRVRVPIGLAPHGACLRCGLPLDEEQPLGQQTHAPDTCVRLLRAAAARAGFLFPPFAEHVPIEAK